MKKILVTDFDKTFYLNELDIEKNKMAVKKWRESGNLFVIATGRSYLDLMEDIEKYNIFFDYAILDHGATIMDAKENILFNFNIPENIIEVLKSDLELDQSTYLFCTSKLESRVDLKHKNISKIGIDYKDNFDIHTLNNKINSHYPLNSYITGSHALEIITNNTDKSKSIKLLANYLKIDSKFIFTIGDSYNDINMIEDYHGFCMKNSIVELKNTSRKQYASVSDLIIEILTNEDNLL